jgi:hypothetical protein
MDLPGTDIHGWLMLRPAVVATHANPDGPTTDDRATAPTDANPGGHATKEP